GAGEAACPQAACRRRTRAGRAAFAAAAQAASPRRVAAPAPRPGRRSVCYTRPMDAPDFSLFADYPWIGAAIAAVIVVVIAAVVHRIGSAVLLRITQPAKVLHATALAIRRPARLVLP